MLVNDRYQLFRETCILRFSLEVPSSDTSNENVNFGVLLRNKEIYPMMSHLGVK